ncbi:MAG: hypothetical protein A2X08_17930 [Bacteroidetes bacterium GWA2_32_17]|nr:MAG: hypothetical protein A2X08_17930 [Bacteroidetes bacterium GWA2_32_17]
MSNKYKYSNEEIINGIKSNNYEIMTYIYKYYYPKVENFIIRKLRGTSEDAKDYFQEALIVLYEGAISNPPLKIHYSIFTFIISVCMHMFKRNKKINKGVTFFEFEEELPSDTETEISELIVKAERIKLYQLHFNELGEKCQILLKLFLEGYLIPEITKILNFASENFTKKRRNQCKKLFFRKIYFDSKLKELINGKPWNIRKLPRW